MSKKGNSKFCIKLSFYKYSIYLFTYTIHTLLCLPIAIFGGGWISEFFQGFGGGIKLSEKDTRYLVEMYGDTNPVYAQIFSGLDFISINSPSAWQVFLYIILAAIIYTLMVAFIKDRKFEENSFFIHYTNALGTIYSSLSGIMLFVTSAFILSIFYIGFVLKMFFTGLMCAVTLMTFLYLLCTFLLLYIQDRSYSFIMYSTGNINNKKDIQLKDNVEGEVLCKLTQEPNDKKVEKLLEKIIEKTSEKIIEKTSEKIIEKTSEKIIENNI